MELLWLSHYPTLQIAESFHIFEERGLYKVQGVRIFGFPRKSLLLGTRVKLLVHRVKEFFSGHKVSSTKMSDRLENQYRCLDLIVMKESKILDLKSLPKWCYSEESLFSTPSVNLITSHVKNICYDPCVEIIVECIFIAKIRWFKLF